MHPSKNWLFRLCTVAAVIPVFTSVPVLAVDHNNIDAGRPLSFDDADAIAYRERAIDIGVGLDVPRRGSAGLELEAEFLMGFALNTHASIGFHPSIGGSDFDPGDVTLGVLHNFNRELENKPALALRGDVSLPTGRDSEDASFRLRGIMSRTAKQYDRVHLNVDLNFTPGAEAGTRSFRPGVVLGYSKPLGYPTRFDTTGVAEIAVQSSEDSGTGPVVSAGIGMRRQVTPRSVFDIGLRSDVAGFRGADRDVVQLIAGYSTAF
jgi:hypothetical protein